MNRRYSILPTSMFLFAVAFFFPHQLPAQIADTFYVKLAQKTPAHPYYGQGSEWGYSLDGVEGRTITLVKDSLYALQIEGLFPEQFPLIFTDPSGEPPFTYRYLAEGDDFANRFIFLKAKKTRKHPDTLYYSSAEYLYSGGMILLVDSPISSVRRERTRLSAVSSSLVPNPIRMSGSLRLSGPIPHIMRLEIVDINGRVVQEVEQDRTDLNTVNIAIDRSGLQSGVYFYRVTDADASSTVLASGSFQVVD